VRTDRRVGQEVVETNSLIAVLGQPVNAQCAFALDRPQQFGPQFRAPFIPETPKRHLVHAMSSHSAIDEAIESENGPIRNSFRGCTTTVALLAWDTIIHSVWTQASSNFRLVPARRQEDPALAFFRGEIMPISIDQQILTDELLRRMAGRAAAYDEENRFFHEDFSDLRSVGYLAACVPREFGGQGFDLGVPRCRVGRRNFTSSRPQNRA
jgi:hypothetical protein